MPGKISVLGRAVCAAVVCVSLVSAASAVKIETVPVGNPGNASDTHGDGYGAVSYEYNIGKYEVTAGQYTEFLNAVAATDTYGLYNPSMDSHSYGCQIQRSGSSGSYTYSVAADWANRPVNYVSWGDAARFANWLHNGQPHQQLTGNPANDLGLTEDGAYYLNGATSDAALLAVDREDDWKWAIPSEDEWYKAAYHKNDGVTGNYFDYPTSSDSVPSNDLVDPDPGNNATFYDNGYTIGIPYYRTEAGAHENSESPYDTFDQGGNVWEWNESIRYGSYRGLRGGSFYYFVSYLHASYRYYNYPAFESFDIGFRVSEVPEPGTMALLALGAVGMLRRRRNVRG
jgi:formylglycine-generating enzyme required for sulfatase activity